MKHLTQTLAVVSLLAPITAQPLGIGDLELHSALNQKLDAEIRLHLAPGENPDDVTVRLAPPEKFDKAGIPWSYSLSKIKFQPAVQADGSMVIKLSSREALTEPFLDILLEVIWPQGSQFREFTVLLDPPAGYHPPVVPSAETSAFQVEPLAMAEERPLQRPRAAKRRAASVKPASNITPQTPTSGEYGPTQRNDTLWAIAKRLGDERNVPVGKMMTALYQANPSAFSRPDIDALKAGVTLKIPETDAILGSGKPRAEKTAEHKKEAAPSKPIAEVKPLELVAPVDTKVTDTAQISEQTKPGAESGEKATATGGADGAASGKDLELQDRIDRLEQQLNMMQQLLALKDQQLSALQSHDQEAARRAAEQAQTLPTTPSVPPAITAPTPSPEQQPVAPTPPQPETKPAPAVQPKPPKPAPAPVAPAEPEGGLFASPAYSLTIGGLGAGLLGVLGWLWWRKRQEEEQTSTDSMFASASQIKLPDTDSSLSVPVIDMNAAASYDVGTVGESSFISDFTPSDFEAFDTDQGEVDPMSEADVYLAYGRYQQAEDLIRHAIAEHPGKDDYKLKLLEIFYANENKERFITYAQELADAGKTADRPFWSKVTDMGKEIAPESALFGGSAAPVQAHKKAETAKADTQFEQKSVEAQQPDIDEDLEDLELSHPDEAESDDHSLDFDLDAFSEKSSPQKADSNETIPDIESIDFDLSTLSIEKPAEDKAASDTDELETFDFNFDLDTETSSKADIEKSPEIKAPELESFDFSELGSVGEEEKQLTNQPEAPGIQLDTPSEFDFSFDFGSSGEGRSDDLDLGVSDLTDMDEFETKIDLAKAYIDMGDTAAAKLIAEEVLEKGNQEQKQAAQAILDEIK